MHRFFVTTFLASIFFYSNAIGQSLNDKIDHLIKQKLPKATVAVLIKDAESNRIIYQRNHDKLLSPASGIKLFTAIAALYGLGPEYRFVTKLLHKANRYYLRFSGSPSLTTTDLSNLLSHLKGHTAKNYVRILIDTSHFKAPDYPDGISYDDIGWYYAAPDTAAILNENAVAYDFIPSTRINKPVKIRVKQPGTGLRLINELKTVSEQDEKKHCRFNIEVKPNNTLRLYGCMARSKRPIRMKLAIPNPLLRAKKAVKNSLKKKGIFLTQPIKNRITPNDAEEISRHESEKLFKLVNHMLKESDNLYANSITKELGFFQTGEATYKQGVFAIEKIISEKAKIDLKGVNLSDGVGTRYNLVTANQMVNLLSAIYKDKPMRLLLLKALPQAGRSGSLTGRMRATPLEGKVYAKTGSMHDISSLSGYMVDSKHPTLIFSIIINGIDQSLATARSLEEDILLAVHQEKKWQMKHNF